MANLLAFVLVTTVANSAVAHPFHTSVAEAEWNSETKRLEVALRVAADDLETALNAQSETRIRLDESDSTDEAIQAYLKETFVIRREAKVDPLELKWSGKEITPKAVWLYFEIESPDGVEGYELTNRVLLETEETQINTLAIKLNGRKVSLRCDRKKPTVVIQSDAAEDEAAP
ncbi:MAG: DUF6702 family protein [Planctomycetia bacterium]|nr:DUF6702 family protein [Planctomycetia bacterium]